MSSFPTGEDCRADPRAGLAGVAHLHPGGEHRQARPPDPRHSHDQTDAGQGH